MNKLLCSVFFIFIFAACNDSSQNQKSADLNQFIQKKESAENSAKEISLEQKNTGCKTGDNFDDLKKLDKPSSSKDGQSQNLLTSGSNCKIH